MEEGETVMAVVSRKQKGINEEFRDLVLSTIREHPGVPRAELTELVLVEWRRRMDHGQVRDTIAIRIQENLNDLEKAGLVERSYVGVSVRWWPRGAERGAGR